MVLSKTYLISQKPIQSWVEYDSSRKQLNITLHPLHVAKPKTPLLSRTKDLSPYLLESMYVGFTSSTDSGKVSDIRPIASFKTSNVAGTFGYISPELSRTGKASTSSDVFMLEITCGRRPVLSRASSLSEMVLTDWVLDCWEDDILHVVDERVKHDDKYLEEVTMVLKFLDSVAQLPRDLFDIVKARENVVATEATASSAQPTSIATVTFTVISFVSYGG